ncbi:hypothetical protein DPEC_G00288960 [Dallia pectoralis]|uniref:Uncharacterized protein n=1 Tax=Dallia pectoralis TaxID=75939 RepID=A0ACC2FKN1_DALPE|nr:hypothetical protein DPEC_G00288960 [Dallia pectoralis]
MDAGDCYNMKMTDYARNYVTEHPHQGDIYPSLCPMHVSSEPDVPGLTGRWGRGCHTKHQPGPGLAALQTCRV